jgi:hypothetical protein
MPSSGRGRVRPPEAADPTTAWAQAAVRGDFVVGELVRYAAERHLRDLRDAASRGYLLPAGARAAGDRLLSVAVHDHRRARGRQAVPPAPVPGLLRRLADGLGQRRRPLALPVRLHRDRQGPGQVAADGGPRPLRDGLVRLRAQPGLLDRGDKQTANVLFKDATAMCRAQVPGYDEGETLEELGHVVIRGEGDNAWKIEHPSSQSFFLPLADGEQQSGPRPRMVLADEIHEFKTDTQIETWARAIDKIAGSAMMVLGTNTPATAQLVGTVLFGDGPEGREGRGLNDTAFAFVARVDKKDRETVFENEACWGKALPALGITFPITNIREAVQTAKTRLSTAIVGQAPLFRHSDRRGRLLDQRGGSGRPSSATSTRRRCAARCWLSLDLSKKNDLTALTATWLDDDGRLWQKTWYWTTKDGRRSGKGRPGALRGVGREGRPRRRRRRDDRLHVRRGAREAALQRP